MFNAIQGLRLKKIKQKTPYTGIYANDLFNVPPRGSIKQKAIGYLHLSKIKIKVMYALTIVDRFGNTVRSTTIDPSSPERAADKFALLYPECWVSLAQTDGDVLVARSPLYMKRDEDRIDSGDMSFDEFHQYWYPVKSDRIRKALVKELNSALKAVTSEAKEEEETDRMLEEREAQEMNTDQYEVED